MRSPSGLCVHAGESRVSSINMELLYLLWIIYKWTCDVNKGVLKL